MSQSQTAPGGAARLCREIPGLSRGRIFANSRAMSSRESFGPNLKRLRLRRGVSLAAIAETTKVGEDLWAAMERNDFSRWPAGIYARAYLRAYAAHIEVDPEAVVDEFCRWFPQGDRRAGRTLHEHATIVGHALEWSEHVVDGEAGVETGRRATDLPVERRFADQCRRAAVHAWQWMAKLTDAARGPRGGFAGGPRHEQPMGEDRAARRPPQAHASR
jgi:transcriptional regulator with XRE-family HTH domain